MAMGNREAEQQQNLFVTHDKLPIPSRPRSSAAADYPAPSAASRPFLNSQASNHWPSPSSFTIAARPRVVRVFPSASAT